MMKKVIDIRQLKKEFHIGEVTVNALNGIDLIIEEGDFVAIMGASGSGKSTLMNLLGCLDQATSGEYFLDGIEVNSLNGDERAAVRNRKIGFVFQGFNLLNRTTALENVELPLLYRSSALSKNAREAAVEALRRVGLEDRLAHKPNQLSGGQQQRVAIARALVNDPAIILADEPTGNLDTRTSIDVMSLFRVLNDQGITIVLVTHEPDIARYAKRIVEIRDGHVKRNVPVVKRTAAGSAGLAMLAEETRSIETLLDHCSATIQKMKEHIDE